jgi:hypothetical protein
LIKFVSEIDSHIGGSLAPSTIKSSTRIRKPRTSSAAILPSQKAARLLETVNENSPLKMPLGELKEVSSIMEQTLEEEWLDLSNEKSVETAKQKCFRPVFACKENITCL